MSRSYKKHPVLKDNASSSHYRKKLANRRYRHLSREQQEKTHWKRHTNSWDIHDYILRWSKRDAIRDWETDNGFYHRKYKTLENYLQKCWYKWYKRK